MSKEQGWLPVVVGRICGFLFAMSAVLVSLFILGNAQEFLDSTQMMLLEMLQGVTLLFLIVSLYYEALLVILGIRFRTFMTARFVAVLFGILVDGTIFGFINFLRTWVRS